MRSGDLKTFDIQRFDFGIKIRLTTFYSRPTAIYLSKENSIVNITDNA